MWGGSAADVIERTAELAGALGADLDGALVTGARDDYGAASAALTEAAAGGVTVLPVYATESDGWWMAKAPDDPSLHLYEDLGVQFVDPRGEDYFWNSAGWEEVPNHPSDVLLYSLRFSMSPEEIAAQPTAALLTGRAGRPAPPLEVHRHGLRRPGRLHDRAGRMADRGAEGHLSGERCRRLGEGRRHRRRACGLRQDDPGEDDDARPPPASR